MTDDDRVRMHLLASVLSLCVVTAIAQPNFVIFAADDLGYDDLAVHGNVDAETPVLDQLFADSVRFENFYVDTVCAPTRAGLLTGRHFLRTGVWGVHGTRDYLNLNEQTFADALRSAGYKTGIFGKWHNGLTDGYLPWDRGFDEACMVELYQYFDNLAQCNGRPRQTKGWATNRIADWAMNFIERNKDNPFALMVPFMTPHLGKTGTGQSAEYWHAPEALVEKYFAKGLSDQLARLYAMIEFMDSNIGRILKKIETEGLKRQTVIIFLSDNGPIGRGLMTEEDWDRRNVHGMRGNKGDVFENGIRVPLFIRWTGKYDPRSVGGALVTVEDIFPTLMELAGVSSVRNRLDGMSLVPILRDPSMDDDVWEGRTLFFTKAAPDSTIRDGVYLLLPNEGRDKSQLVFGEGGAWAVRRRQFKFMNSYGVQHLFNLELDPQESVELTDVLRRDVLELALRSWWNDILTDPASFGRPTFYLGRSNFSQFYMMGATETSSNIMVRSHTVEGNIFPGNYLKYKAIVAAPGTYRLDLKQGSAWRGQITVDVFCGEQQAAANGRVGETVRMTIEIPFTGDDCLVQLKIRNGTGWFQASTFSFTFVA